MKAYGLSPEAEKAQRESSARSALRAMNLSPSLARTASMAVILRPEFGGRVRQVAWMKWIGDKLPAFRFNPARNRWEAPLEVLADAVAAFEAAGIPAPNVSRGVREWLEGRA